MLKTHFGMYFVRTEKNLKHRIASKVGMKYDRNSPGGVNFHS